MTTISSPLITVVIATYNEERHIAACLVGFRSQVDLPGEIEILVVDGGSTDRTVDIVRALAEGDPNIRILPNPGRFQVFAWNIGTREARGRFVALCSAHTEYAEDYLARCYEAHQRSGAANVGGIQVPVGHGVIGQAIALAMQSPFAIGNAQFRYARQEAFVDAVFGDFIERSLLLKVGGFDESFPSSEDTEFYIRLRRAGYRIFMSPSIRLRYHVRPSIPAVARQMFRYGFWRRRIQLEYPRFVPLRVMAPPLLVFGTLLSLIAFAVSRSPIVLVIPALYVLFVAAAVLTTAVRSRSPIPSLCLAVVLPAMHFSYGIGWWAGLIVQRRRGVRGALESLVAAPTGPRATGTA